MAPGLVPVLAGSVRVWAGEPRADATLERMVDITKNEYENAALVEVAVDIVDSAPGPERFAQDILKWLRAHVSFVPDPVAQQLLKTPLYMLSLIQRDKRTGGDCVDVAMLSAALSMAVGMRADFIAEAYRGGPTSPLVHVYTIVRTPVGWVNMDTQRTPDQADTRPVRRVRLPIL